MPDLESYRVFRFSRPATQMATDLKEKLDLNDQQTQQFQVEIDAWMKRYVSSYLDFYPEA